MGRRGGMREITGRTVPEYLKHACTDQAVHVGRRKNLA